MIQAQEILASILASQRFSEKQPKSSQNMTHTVRSAQAQQMDTPACRQSRKQPAPGTCGLALALRGCGNPHNKKHLSRRRQGCCAH